MKITLSEEIIHNTIKKVIKEYYNSTSSNRIIPGNNKYYRMKWDYRFLFGRRKGKTIEEIFNDGLMGKEYLIWAYYNLEFTDFTPEILEALGIEPIEKPGTNQELFLKYKNEYMNGLSDEDKETMKIGFMRGRKMNKDHSRRVAAAADAMQDKVDNALSNNGRLAWKNQGHF